MLNGGLTVGTLDGANVEMAEEIGEDNIFIFGMTVEEVEVLKARGYNAMEYYNNDKELKQVSIAEKENSFQHLIICLQVIDMIRDGFFTPGNEGEFKDLVDMLLHHDRFLTLADFRAYVTSQELVSQVYRDQARYQEINQSILSTD